MLPGMVRTGVTFADAAAEFLRYVEFDRTLKPSTLRGYRSIIDAYLLPAFGPRRLEDITTREVELWRSTTGARCRRRAWRETAKASLFGMNTRSDDQALIEMLRLRESSELFTAIVPRCSPAGKLSDGSDASGVGVWRVGYRGDPLSFVCRRPASGATLR